MKRFSLAIMVAAMLLFCAGVASAQDIDLRNRNINHNELVNTNNITNNSTATSNATGGNATVINHGDQRQFVGLPAGGLQINLIAPSTRTSHRTNDGTGVVEYGYFTQGSYDGMKSFMDKVHAKYPNTRTWADIEENLVIQPRFDHPRTELADTVAVRVYANSNYMLKGIRPENVVGYLTVRDIKPQENSVDSMYFVVALYPIAKMGGANVLIKVDNYFWSNVKSNSWGIGAGAGWSQILSCLTGFSAAGNLGYNQGNAAERVAGGEMYLALYVPDAPAAPAAVVPAAAPQAKACDQLSIYNALEKNRIAIYGDGGSKKGCEDYCLNNLRLRAERGKLFYDLYKCTGDMEALKAAKDNYAIAARNYKFGSDIKKNQAEADKLIDQVYEAWSEIGGK